MHTDAPQPIFLKDYAAPDWLIDRVDLHVSIHEAYAEVRAVLACRRRPEAAADRPLVLNGEELALQAVGIDGSALAPSRYLLTDDKLTVSGVDGAPLAAEFALETIVHIHPDKNTQLSGLYKSKDGYFTQCEAERFRRITFSPDRPDVMARFTCTVEADKARFPQLLSNGNLLETGDAPNGRHWAKWEDPFAKPSYLFALVAAKLDVFEDRFVTKSGRSVHCAVYVEPGKLDQCEHAMAALKKSMKWDEERFGLEMDLDIYMIVAVGDFNMGAMENKGLNIFNTKYVLARPDTATDTDYQNIDRVVAHEYFHNWTGNRVTCRDWFQLSLKEGLTVYRDQEFGEDVHSRAVTRVQEVRTLRIAQFPEDAGPMAHPIRPASYAEINNFYTATVYEKGAQIIRMIETLIGRESFRKGMDLYFTRHDGQAVTCEDFVSAMQDASKIDLTQFRRWYARAGTPRLKAEGQYDAAAKRYTLTLTQSLAPTAYEQRLKDADIPVEDGPLHMPVALGLVLPDGSDAQLPGATRILSLTETTQNFVFDNIPAEPVASLLRGFSAPVHLEFDQTDAELAHLMAHDSDAFNRWEAGQRLATRVLLAGIAMGGHGDTWIPDSLITAFARILDDVRNEAADPGLAAEALSLPAEPVLAEEVVARGDHIDPEAIHLARLNLRRHLAQVLRDRFEAVWSDLAPREPYAPSGMQTGRRSLRNLCLAYLAESDAGYLQSSVLPRLLTQFREGGNMTDVIAALSTLANLDVAERDASLEAFYAQWKDEALVVDKWLQVQATSRLSGTDVQVRRLMKHPAFDLKNPNKVYSLVRAFCGANPRHFHALDGSGYQLAADVIIDLQAMNPQVASRIARSFDRWKQFDTVRQKHARAALERIQACPDLASDVAEVIGNALR